MNFKNQTEDDIKVFVQRLQLLKMDDIGPVFYEMLPLCGCGPALAFCRFLSLQNKIAFGAHALINAYRKNHKNLWDDYLEDCHWERSMYFENAIEAYNKVLDYVYVILYFNFNIYKKLDNKELKTKEDIVWLSKKIKGNKIENIKKQIMNIEGTGNFLAELMNYENSIKEMRELANDIKHRGCFIIEGTELPRITKVERNIDGIKIDITELVSPRILNLDVEIEKLVEVHRKTIDLQKKLYSICGFKNQLKNFLASNVK